MSVKEDNYMDIIDMPHHVSESRPRMSLRNRAAQFAPFAALSGHAERISEVDEEMFRLMEYGDENNGYFKFEESI